MNNTPFADLTPDVIAGMTEDELEAVDDRINVFLFQNQSLDPVTYRHLSNFKSLIQNHQRVNEIKHAYVYELLELRDDIKYFQLTSIEDIQALVELLDKFDFEISPSHGAVIDWRGESYMISRRTNPYGWNSINEFPDLVAALSRAESDWLENGEIE